MKLQVCSLFDFEQSEHTSLDGFSGLYWGDRKGVGVDSSNCRDSGEMKQAYDRTATVAQGGGSDGCHLL